MNGVGAEDDVAELNAMGRNSVAKREIILAEEVGEIVKQNKENAECSSIQVAGCRLEVLGLQEWGDEAQQGHEELVEGGPALKIVVRGAARGDAK